MRVYRYRALHKHLYEDNEAIMRSQDTGTMIRSNERQRVKIGEYTFSLEVYEAIANETGDDETKE